MIKQTKLWTLRGGSKIRICDMEDKHLLNTISMLRRVAVKKRQEEIEHMICPAPCGDVAQDMFSDGYDQLLESSWEDFVHELFEPMVIEAERRGLELPSQI